ncbi:hypothetical protein [Oceaniglobus trochenteri]|uniref:hypothetical protein n=1 Tax=Oceaniglobus trochenteri TaxID=2763260 RepID=UPI001CFF8B12|nr:hypothetical protein [Oceaniglobus trochenteri]
MKPNAYFAALVAVATSVAALPALAQSYSAGHVQLSQSVGVAPGTLTDGQLILLNQALSEGGATGRANAEHILKSAGIGRISTSGQGAGDQGRAILLEQARQENDAFLIRQLSTAADDTTASDRGAVTPGKAQLAASLGVNAADYTTAELVLLSTR